MGRKSKAEQEIDRAIGEWKQDLLDESSAIIGQDFTALRDELAKTNETLGELHREAKNATSQASKARHSLEKDRKNYRKHFNLYAAGFCFLSSLFGSFITFLLLWYFW